MVVKITPCIYCQVGSSSCEEEETREKKKRLIAHSFCKQTEVCKLQKKKKKKKVHYEHTNLMYKDKLLMSKEAKQFSIVYDIVYNQTLRYTCGILVECV